MSTPVSTTPYQAFSRWLHWISLPLVGVLLGLGWYMTALPLGLERFQTFNLHKSLGALLLIVTVIRLGYRLLRPSPAHPAKGLQQTLAHLGHVGLYLCLFGLPLSGWLLSNAAGYPVSLFDLLELPGLIAEQETRVDPLTLLHKALIWLLCLLLGGHLLAVFWHQWIKKDSTLSRMWPSIRS